MQDRFKFRLWIKDMGLYFTKPCIFLNTDGLLVSDDGVKVYEIDQKAHIIEFCTGLKDRNQKLIYEGDILDFDLSTPKNGGHYRGFIRWQEQNDLIGWVISDMDMVGEWDLRQIAHPNDWMVYGEIIGNIHENADLIKVGGK